MRPAFPLLALVIYAPAAFGQDAKVTYFAKQLKTASDPRVRVQTALLLGSTGKPDAVDALCDIGMKDSEAIVRSASANALGDLGLGGQACLKAATSDPDSSVASAAKKALEKLASAVAPGSLYFSVDEVKSDVGDDASKLAAQLLRQKLTTMGGTIAPQGESKAAATALVKSKKLRAFLLQPKVNADGSGLKFEILVMTYPDQALQGSFNVKGKGGKPEKLLKAMVPRVIDDAADELRWKEP
ncbi:MAG: HEAT repeat domain-containing protein [Myxococcaceae bacterium]